MVSSNMIVNCPETPQDIKNSDKIFGPDVLSMKGKSIRRCLEAVVSNYVNTPKEILSMDTGLEVFVGVVFVNKLAFLVSVIRRLKLTTINYIPKSLEKKLARSVNNIIDVYKQRHFSIHTMYMDPEFNCLYKLIVSTDLNKNFARDHVPGIERHIQIVKERTREFYGGLPYDRMTSRMIVYLHKYVVMMINAFPPNRSLSRTYSPCNIMMGKQLDFKKQCRCPFGGYIKDHNNRNVTNVMVDRTQGIICLSPTGNL